MLPSMDAIAGLLDGPRAREAFLLRSSLDPPWSLRIEDRAPLTVLAMTRGSAHVVPADGEPVVLHAGAEEARVLVEVRPALAMEEMFAEVVALARAGRMTRRGLPRNPLELADLARRYDHEAHAPFLGVAAQRLLLAPLVFAARHPRAGLAAVAASGAGVAVLA